MSRRAEILRPLVAEDFGCGGPAGCNPQGCNPRLNCSNEFVVCGRQRSRIGVPIVQNALAGSGPREPKPEKPGIPMRRIEVHPQDRGVKGFSCPRSRPLSGQPLRTGEVWYDFGDKTQMNFHQATLALHIDGFTITPHEPELSPLAITAALTPFAMSQALALQPEDESGGKPNAWVRLFKVTIFHHGMTHVFAIKGENADSLRARWIADIVRVLRTLTLSLFPPATIRTQPIRGLECTATRLMAGYALMCDTMGCSMIYVELHANIGNTATFAIYEDELCDSRLLVIKIDVNTNVCERMGVDCSCFSLDDHHFSVRTSAEKKLWLRAVSNLKVKMRHDAGDPTGEQLVVYRLSVEESVSKLPAPSLPSSIAEVPIVVDRPVLPRRYRPWQACGEAPDPMPVILPSEVTTAAGLTQVSRNVPMALDAEDESSNASLPAGPVFGSGFKGLLPEDTSSEEEEEEDRLNHETGSEIEAMPVRPPRSSAIADLPFPTFQRLDRGSSEDSQVRGDPSQVVSTVSRLLGQEKFLAMKCASRGHPMPFMSGGDGPMYTTGMQRVGEHLESGPEETEEFWTEATTQPGAASAEAAEAAGTRFTPSTPARGGLKRPGGGYYGSPPQPAAFERHCHPPLLSKEDTDTTLGRANSMSSEIGPADPRRLAGELGGTPCGFEEGETVSADDVPDAGTGAGKNYPAVPSSIPGKQPSLQVPQL
eukprot:TRINITY_DN23015_c0_g1_i1.p1 TRINITY_DN23015_c0_g1~~TRINITY_DN23015_c0_g1_i1.p1  ORF type:complete len:708 (+),score=122.12 TRINITY_DN23015_c0_g1_i1:109-2232(+)